MEKRCVYFALRTQFFIIVLSLLLLFYCPSCLPRLQSVKETGYQKYSPFDFVNEFQCLYQIWKHCWKSFSESKFIYTVLLPWMPCSDSDETLSWWLFQLGKVAWYQISGLQRIVLSSPPNCFTVLSQDRVWCHKPLLLLRIIVPGPVVLRTTSVPWTANGHAAALKWHD